MNCEEFNDLVYDYEYDLLEKQEQQNFERHAQNCYSCQERLEQSKKGIKLLQYWQPAVKKISIPPVVPQKSISPFIFAAAIFLLISVSIVFGIVLKQKETARLLAIQENQKKTKTIATYEKHITSLEEVIKSNEHIIQLNNEKEKIYDILKQIATLREESQQIKQKIPLYRSESQIRKKLENHLAGLVDREKQLQTQIFAQNMFEKMDNLSPSEEMEKIREKAFSYNLNIDIDILFQAQNNVAQNAEDYQHTPEAIPLNTIYDAESAFSLDIDTASYTNIRRFINEGKMPDKNAVRIEEMVNYFHYDYPEPAGNQDFSVHTELSECPWNTQNLLMKIGIKGRKVPKSQRPNCNIVFLIDVSGSMSDHNKLNLVKESLKICIDQLQRQDRIALVTYANEARIVLNTTIVGTHKAKIIEAIDNLKAEGSTHGSAGIHIAYDIALANYIAKGANRVILATDGDFNVGTTDQQELTKLVQYKAKDNIFLTVVGVGTGNYKDSLLEKLADNGNGHLVYLDSLKEAKKVFIQQIYGTLFTIAQDAKVKVEFNPVIVELARLIGYDNRIMSKQEFDNPEKDVGDIGAGHTITVFYEITPTTTPVEINPHKKRYQKKIFLPNATQDEILYLQIRYKDPHSKKDTEIAIPAKNTLIKEPSANFTFAAAVAGFGMLLKDSQYKETLTYEIVQKMAETNTLEREERKEFVTLVKKVLAYKEVLFGFTETNHRSIEKDSIEKDNIEKDNIEKLLRTLRIRKQKLEQIITYMNQAIQEWERKYPAQKNFFPYPKATEAMLKAANIEFAELEELIADGEKYIEKGEYNEGAKILISYVRDVPSVLPATEICWKNLQEIIAKNKILSDNKIHVEWKKSPGPWYDNVQYYLDIFDSLDPKIHQLLNPKAKRFYPFIESDIYRMKVLDSMGNMGILIYGIEMERGKSIQEIVLAKQKNVLHLQDKQKYDKLIKFLETRILEVHVENLSLQLSDAVTHLRTITENSQTVSDKDLIQISNPLRLIKQKFDESYHEIYTILRNLEK